MGGDFVRWQRHCRRSCSAERTKTPGAPGRGVTRERRSSKRKEVEGKREALSLRPLEALTSGTKEASFLHLFCLKRPRPWRILS